MNAKLSRVYRGILRAPLNNKNQKKLQNRDVSILCSNCVGGVIYHELGLRFLSPTINLFMEPCHFIKFLKNPYNYHGKDMRMMPQTGESYPVVKIEDIVLHCVHYHSLVEVESKWNSRFERINWNNMRVIMSERDGCTMEDLLEFDNLPYENKVVFVHKKMPEIKSAIYIPGTEMDGTDGHWVSPLTSYAGRFTGRRTIDMWDYVSFLNDGRIR